MKPAWRFLAVLWVLSAASLAAGAKGNPKTKSGFVTTPDGVKIHYLEAGVAKTAGNFQIGGTPPAGAVTAGQVSLSQLHRQPSILFVTGWTMPAWIWRKQIDYFARNYRVVAMDPRCQGESSQTTEGLYPAARARDIAAVIQKLDLAPVVLVGWSMAVTEAVAYVAQFGTKDLAGLVLVDDDAGGATPAEAGRDLEFIDQVLTNRQKVVPEFIRTLFFKQPQPEAYIERVTQASLRVPTSTAVALLVGKFGADYRPALAKIDKPTLVCVAKSPYMQSIVRMQEQIAGSHLEVFDGAGHALFVDDPAGFDSALGRFLTALAR
jgi:non-heme chloroperoxidase